MRKTSTRMRKRSIRRRRKDRGGGEELVAEGLAAMLRHGKYKTLLTTQFKGMRRFLSIISQITMAITYTIPFHILKFSIWLTHIHV